MPNLLWRTLTKPTLFLLLGLILGGAAIAIGYVVSGQLSHKVETLVSECAAANLKRAAANLKPVPADAPAWARDQMVCELRELESSTGPSSRRLVGVQASIVETHAASLAWRGQSRTIGALLFGVLALPYCWHFLLRRIAELHQAMLGR